MLESTGRARGLVAGAEIDIGARRADTRRTDEKRLLERYEIRIDWPEGSAPDASKP